MNELNNTYKIIFVGDTYVGKTCIIRRGILNKFSDQINTVSPSYFEMKKQIDDTTIHFKIFDTAGNEKYSSMNKKYYRDAHAVVIVYSFDDMLSFGNVEKWHNETLDVIDNNTLFYLVANKFDLFYDSSNSNVISIENGEERAKKLNMKFICTSAKTSYNIYELFDDISKDVFEKYHLNRHEIINNGNVDITEVNNEKKCSC